MSNSQIQDPKVLRFTNVGDGLQVTYEGLPEEVLATEVRVANAIKEFLFSEQITEFKTKDIMEAKDKIGFQKSLLSSGLGCLIKNGFLKKVKRGCYEIVGEDKQQTKLKKQPTPNFEKVDLNE